MPNTTASATLCVLTKLVLAALVLPAGAQSLPAHKDELFAYPALLESTDDGARRVFAYDEMRDINGRDEEPERRVQGRYVALGVRSQQADLVAETSAGKVPHFAVGKRQSAKVIVVYLHGQGGSRKQGVDDWTFGGNFNRIKNLVVQAGGLYLSPDFTDFGAKGAAEVSALISAYASASPGAKIYVACGSMGGMLCWRLADDATVAPRLGGLLLLGSLWDDKFLASAAFKARIPLLIAQGSRDKVFPLARIEAFYSAIRKKAKAYPVRLVVFDTGGHGTPIRMTDWRETINWMEQAR